MVYFPTTDVSDIYLIFFTCQEKVSELVAVHGHHLLLLALHQQTLRPFPLNINILSKIIKIDPLCPRFGRCWRATYLTPAFSMKTRNCTNWETDQVTGVDQFLVFPLVGLHALLHVELLELLHLRVGLPGDEEAGVAGELLPLLLQGHHCALLQHLLQAHVATHLRTLQFLSIWHTRCNLPRGPSHSSSWHSGEFGLEVIECPPWGQLSIMVNVLAEVWLTCKDGNVRFWNLDEKAGERRESFSTASKAAWVAATSSSIRRLRSKSWILSDMDSMSWNLFKFVPTSDTPTRTSSSLSWEWHRPKYRDMRQKYSRE